MSTPRATFTASSTTSTSARRPRSDAATSPARAANYGIGASAQLEIFGSDAANIVVGGYDNDRVDGSGGNDLLMGGNLNHLRNPNLVGIWNDGQMN